MKCMKIQLIIIASSLFSILSGCGKFEMGERFMSAAQWQAALPDEMPVCCVSLPGAHDAATGSIDIPLVKDYARTQVLSIQQQWDYGVRVFDLRPAVVADTLLICHGSIKTRTGFKEALYTIVSALDATPTEFAIILIRHEIESDNNNGEWGGIMADCINSLPCSKVVRDFTPEMSVGQMRGRILFLFREDIADTTVGARIYGWTSSREINKQKSARIGSGSLWVQDYYDPQGEKDKIGAVKELLRGFSDSKNGFTWCINHTSAYLPAIFGAPDYGANAQNINAKIAGFIRSSIHGSTGIVMMDFAGASSYSSYEVGGDILLQAVIENNI